MTNDTNDNKDYGEELSRKIWITKGTRFNAHQRLTSKHNWSLAAISFSSAYVLIITIVGYFPIFSLNSQQKDILSFFAITLSLFILVLSLLETSKSHQMKAKEFHDCGRRLSGLYDKLRHILTIGKSNISMTELSAQLLLITKEYDSILDQCNENHKEINLVIFKIQNKESFPDFNSGFFNKLLFSYKSCFHTSLPYFILIVLPPVLVILMFAIF
jgi:hypothetical protein